MSKLASYDLTSRICTGTYTAAGDIPTRPNQGSRIITDLEYQTICALRAAGSKAVVLDASVREATADETDDGRSVQDFLERKVKALTLAERLTAYPKLAATLTAFNAGDRNGSKAQVDTITELAAAARTRAKNIIDRTLS